MAKRVSKKLLILDASLFRRLIAVESFSNTIESVRNWHGTPSEMLLDLAPFCELFFLESFFFELIFLESFFFELIFLDHTFLTI